MLDIAILIIPKIDPYAPTVGPAVLKSHLLSEGFSCKIIDLNVQLYNIMTDEDKEKYYHTADDRIFVTNVDYELNKKERIFLKKYKVWAEGVINELKKLNPRYVGMSLLTEYSRTFAIHFSTLIRKYLPNTKIVWGGADVRGRRARRLITKGVIDFFIHGDAEFSLVELLRGNLSAPGINSMDAHQVEDLSTVLTPDYSDIEWDTYPSRYKDGKTVYITGSRGCVKNCTFCDIHRLWPKYKFRSSKSVFDEIVEIRKKWHRTDFHFTDSLINGSMKTFRELLHLLKEYRKTDPGFSWSSQWIMRPQSQCTADDFQLMKDSGCARLEVGLESFSESVRFHMGKKIKDEDMWFCFEQLQKQKIQHSLLMIVGYPTETVNDHQITLDTIRKLKEIGYADATLSEESLTPLIHFGFGNTLILDHDTILYENLKNELTYYKDPMNWQYKDNSPEVRKQRMAEIWKLIDSIRGDDPHMQKQLTTHLGKFDNMF